MTALLRGEAADLSTIALDMERVPPFHRRVYEAARTIAPGATLSYGEVAQNIAATGSIRAAIFADADHNGIFDSGEKAVHKMLFK